MMGFIWNTSGLAFSAALKQSTAFEYSPERLKRTPRPTWGLDGHMTHTPFSHAPDLHIRVQILRGHLSCFYVEVSDCCVVFPVQEGRKEGRKGGRGGGREEGRGGGEEGGREGRVACSTMKYAHMYVHVHTYMMCLHVCVVCVCACVYVCACVRCVLWDSKPTLS